MENLLRNLLGKRKSKLARIMGFTLIEVVVAVAILVVLAAVLIPTLIPYVEDTRKAKDMKLAEEMVEVARFAVSKVDIFDEVYHYAITNNYITYSDSSGSYGQTVEDEEFWAPDGLGHATTITFNPVDVNGTLKYVMSEAIINDMTYGNGSMTVPARVMDATDAYVSQCKMIEMTKDDTEPSSLLYNEFVRNFGESIAMESATYKNSSFTIFVTYEYIDETITPSVYGMFNGTNLEGVTFAATGTGSTGVIETPEGETQGNGTQSGTVQSEIDYSGLVGGGGATYKPTVTQSNATFSKSKFLAFCNDITDKDSITEVQFVTNGNRDDATDVSVEGNGELVMWREGSGLYISAAENGKKVKLDADISHLFDPAQTGLNNLTRIMMFNTDASAVTNVSSLFRGNSQLTTVDISGLAFANATDMSYMFSGCSNLYSLKCSAWNTAKVTNMAYLFENCSKLAKLPIASWNTSKVTNMSGLFKGCNAVKELNVTHFNTAKCENFESMFDGCLRISTLDVSGFVVDKGTSFAAMFKDCVKVPTIDMSRWMALNATDFREMFANCKQVTELNLEGFTTTNVTDMSKMFYDCQNIKTLDISNFDNRNCSGVTSMFDGMIRLEEITVGARFGFRGNGSTICVLPSPSNKYIEDANGTWTSDGGTVYAPAAIPNFMAATYYAINDTTTAVMAPRDTWWRGSTPKATITRIQLVNSYTSTSYSEVFNADEENDGSLKVYVEGTTAYICNTRTQRAKNAIRLSKDATNTFAGFTSLRQINGLKLINPINAESLDGLFDGCVALESISGYEKWNVQNVKSAQYIFRDTKVATLAIGDWQMLNCKNMSNLFANCGATTIDLSAWDVTGVTNFSYMFAGSQKLNTILLKNWETQGDANYTGMFDNCYRLVTIKASNKFVVNNPSTPMFTQCVALVGSMGTSFIDASALYARVDKDDAPGYFSEDNTTGTFVAKLYDSGTPSLAYTDLTKNGKAATPWNYYSDARMLEINAFSMPRGEKKIIEITVPAGMIIMPNKWTTPNTEVASVTFTPLDLDANASGLQQGMGKYSNSQTGTLKYVISDYAQAATIQCLVMFDYTVWNKAAAGAWSGTSDLTLTDPITVTLGGEIVRKISSVTSATSIGSATQGFSIYYNTNTNNAYEGETLKAITSNSILATDQSTLKHYFKSMDIEIFAEGQTSKVKAKIVNQAENSTLASFSPTDYSTDYLYKKHWDNVYTTTTMSFARPQFLLESGAGWVEGETLKYTQKITLTSLTGQSKTFTTTKNFTIKATTLNPKDLTYGTGGKSVPAAAYYTEPYHCDCLGTFTAAYKGYSALPDTTFEYTYDTTAAAGAAPILEVMGARVAVPNGQTVTLNVTLIDKSGTQHGPYQKTIKSTSDTNGVFVNPLVIASENGLSGNNYFLKKITYTVPTISGGTAEHYLYSTGGSGAPSSAGTFVGRANGAGKSTLSVYYNGTKINGTVTTSTSVTSNPIYAGYIDSIKLPKGDVVTAGQDVQMNALIQADTYPYSNSQVLKRPEVYVILPDGVNIKGVVVSTSETGAAISATPIVTKIKAVEKDGVPSFVYKISFEEDVYLSACYVSPTATSNGYGTYRLWVRILMGTEPAMDTTTINVKSSIYFKDTDGHVSVGGARAAYCNTDPYDVDNDGSTSDKYGSTNKADLKISINAQ